jgi:hypothetical protein
MSFNPSFIDPGQGRTAPAATRHLAPGLEPGCGAHEATPAARIARPSLQPSPVLRASSGVGRSLSLGAAASGDRVEPMPILAAFHLATRLHAGQVRPDGVPWDQHLRLVFAEAVGACRRRDELIAALLHGALASGLATSEELVAAGVSPAAIDLMHAWPPHAR